MNRYIVRSKIILATQSLCNNTSALPASRLLFQIRKLGLVNLSRVTVAPVMPSAPLAAVVLGNFSSALHHPSVSRRLPANVRGTAVALSATDGLPPDGRSG
jgi:hypothetical protein